MSKFNITHCTAENKVTGNQDSLFTRVKNKLEQSKKVKDRTYNISSFDDISEGIIQFEIKDNFLWCVYARFKTGGKTLDNSVFDKKILPIKNAIGEKEKLQLDRYIFMLIDKNELVMKTGISQKTIGIYFNWLLSLENDKKQKYGIVQSKREVVPEKKFTLADISKFTLTPTKYVDSDSTEIITKKKHLTQAFFQVIKEQGGFEDLKDLQDEDILDISLDIKLKHTRKKENINNELWEKHISHNPHLYTLHLKDGRKIKASVLELKKLIDVEEINNLYNEQDIYQKMVTFLQECRENND